jgi:hypothetical protein
MDAAGVRAAREPSSWKRVFGALADLYVVHSLKLYRFEIDLAPPVPILPCLDHEAALHGRIPPHWAAYLEDRATGDLHEVVFIPSQWRVRVDTVSTSGEYSPDSHERLVARLRRQFPDHAIAAERPSWARSERRVTEVCRAHVTLREVLCGKDLERAKAGVGRLQTIAALMEKESRVSSWGVRTVTGPILTLAGFLTFQILGRMGAMLSTVVIDSLRYGIIGGLGAYFLYYGLRAVQLTAVSSRIWKRAAEYDLILDARRRQQHRAPGG